MLQFMGLQTVRHDLVTEQPSPMSRLRAFYSQCIPKQGTEDKTVSFPQRFRGTNMLFIHKDNISIFSENLNTREF